MAHHSFQIAGMNEHFKRHPLSMFLDAMVSLEIESIELWAGSPHLYVEDASVQEVEKLRRDIQERGLHLICLTPEQCIYPVNIAAKEPEVRQRSIEYFLKSLEISSALECNMLQIVPGKGYYDESTGEAWKRSRESLEIIAKKAEQMSISVVLEALEKKESNLIPDSLSLKRMLEEIKSPNLKAVVDTCPMAAAGESFTDCFRELGSDIKHVHLADSFHSVLGEGTLPIYQYLDELTKHNYRGFVTIEIVGRTYVFEPVKAIQKSLAYLDQYAVSKAAL
ncbi:sugar phosphate isomerase/epimerase family protein [Domibacillus robiginosus]|uniref:sugar phosphate isomerase/epimerase family protein n=1 Tax=Domibacillus robiginosus TaxID=1071054 RepID=UPI00067D5CAC|nr:sugar phosphate isomerase/epimerase family protein [Domibacillus robiginosus]